MPEEHKQIRKYMVDHKCTQYQAEKMTAGFTHPLVGQMLGESWKLPKTICGAISDHHAPRLDTDGGIEYSGIVHLGNHLAARTFHPEILRISGWEHIQTPLLHRLNFTSETIDALCQRLLDEYGNSSTFLQLAMAS